MKISVVIPAKNRAKTLPYCLESILNQTYSVNEIIVVDDNSSDDTKAVVGSYAKRGVRYEKLENARGAQAARNHGINASKYEWIAFQDSDDRWLPNKMEVQIEVLKDKGYDKNIVVHTCGYKLNSEDKSKSIMSAPVFNGSCTQDLIIKPGPMFQGMLVHKEKLLQIGMLDILCPSYQEWDTSIRLSRVCEFVHIQQPLFEWIWHAGETISKDGKRDVNGFQYVINKNRAEIIDYHGLKGWQNIQVVNAMRAAQYGLYSDANVMLNTLSNSSAVLLLKLLSKIHFFPRGSWSLAHYLGKLNF